MNDSSDYILFYTLGCHLCDDAEVLLEPLLSNLGLSYRKRDIADNEALLERYGVRIPVLCHSGNGAEPDWPFDDKALDSFVRANL